MVWLRKARKTWILTDIWTDKLWRNWKFPSYFTAYFKKSWLALLVVIMRCNNVFIEQHEQWLHYLLYQVWNKRCIFSGCHGNTYLVNLISNIYLKTEKRFMMMYTPEKFFFQYYSNAPQRGRGKVNNNLACDARCSQGLRQICSSWFLSLVIFCID